MHRISSSSLFIASFLSFIPIFPGEVQAQSRQEVRTSAFMQCAATTVIGRDIFEIKTKVFSVESNDQTILNSVSSSWDSFVTREGKEGHNGGVEGLTNFLGGPYPRCVFTGASGTSGHIIDNNRTTPDAIDWSPPKEAAALASPQTPIKSISLNFQPGDRSGQGSAYRGYRSASIKLNYRFLLCANEIQIAYSLDRKSLEHSQDYVERFESINPKYVVPTSEPRVPDTIPLQVMIKYGFPPQAISRLEDGTTGEALGMGCFSGQTRKIGLVGALVGPKATMPQIKAYLDQLTVDLMYVEWDFGYPLLNPDVPVPPGTKPLSPRKLTGRAPAPIEPRVNTAEDSAKLTAANASSAAAARASVEKMAADRKAYQDGVAANQARREADLRAYNAQVNRIAQETARKKQEYDAAMAAWRVTACAAGTKSAC